MKAPPFVIRREARTTLTEQIVRGITGAIRSGYYPPGEQLPTMLEMSAHLGVSMMVLRRAVARLAAAGEVSVRRRSGIRVSTTHDPVFKAHVGYFSPGTSASYYFAQRDLAFASMLRQHDIRVSIIPIGGREAAQSFPSVRHLLDLQPVDLAVVGGLTCGIENLLAERRVPWIHAFPDNEVAGAIDRVAQERSACHQQLAAHVQRCGVRSAVVLANDPAHPVMAALRAVGVDVHGEPLQVLPGAAVSEVPMERAGYTAVQALLHRRPLPDLVYAADDYAARGALAALQSAGVRIPRDVQFAMLANAGHVPVIGRTITRIEMYPQREGEAMAHCVLRYLRSPGRARRPLVLRPRFVVGRTTTRRAPRSPESA